MKKNIRNTLWTLAILSIVAITSYFLAGTDSWRVTSPPVPSVDYWQMFAGISLERTYIEEARAHYRTPVFTQELIAYTGKEVTLTGYYLPYSKIDSIIIVSRFPNSSCFFCGQAGVESVAMVVLEKTGRNLFQTDQLLSVRGKLALNSTDINKLAFILEDAEVESLLD
ncbi:MAG: hypothetical protein AAGA66_12500 [Bacteroidota bacterium]